MKRFLALFLSLAICLSICPVGAFAEEVSDAELTADTAEAFEVPEEVTPEEVIPEEVSEVLPEEPAEELPEEIAEVILEEAEQTDELIPEEAEQVDENEQSEDELSEANDSVPAKFSVSDVSAAKLGDTVVLDIALADNPGICGMTLRFNYDETVFDRVSLAAAPEFPHGNNDPEWVLAKNAVWGNTENLTYNGKLLTLTLKVKEDAPVGTYTVSLNCADGDICDNGGASGSEPRSVPFTLIPGSVTVVPTVLYDADGGEGAPAAQAVPAEISSVKPVWEDHIFLHWEDAEGVKYNAGDTYNTQAHLRLHAVWGVWGSTTYSWNDDDHSKCTAKRECTTDSSIYETAEADVTFEITNDPTCTGKGTKRYTAAFSEAWAITQTFEEPVDSLGHDWDEIVYSWNDDHSVCTATRVCKRDNSHIETANANSTFEVTVPPTCEGTGTKVYTAVFSEEWAGSKTFDETLPALDHDWDTVTYEWNDDHSVCTATRVCKRDGSHIETANANSTSEVTVPPTCEGTGTKVYTAVFSEEWAGSKTFDETLSALGHDMDEVTYVWNEDHSVCTAKRVCKRDGCTYSETSSGVVTEKTLTEPTCAKVGTKEITAEFPDEWAGETSVKVDIPFDESKHVWGVVSYSWNSDHTECTAKRFCIVDKAHFEEAHATAQPVEEESRPAACKETGKKTVKAAFDKDWAKEQTYSEELPMLDHKIVIDEAKAPTCTETGLTEGKHCELCKEVILAQEEIPAKGHVWDSGTDTGRTDEDSGLPIYHFTCTVDGCGFGEDRIGSIVAISGPDEAASGKSITLTASVLPEPENAPAFTWALAEGDEAFATVKFNAKASQTLTVTIAAGLTESHTIKVIASSDGAAAAEKEIRIIPVATGLQINRNDEIVTGKSITVDLNETTSLAFDATLLPVGADVSGSITWKCSDTKGVSVENINDNEKGTITFDLIPDANLTTLTFTATDSVSKKSANVKVITTRLSTGVEITVPDRAEPVESGNTVKLTASVQSVNGKPKDSTVVWSIPAEYSAFATVSSGTVKVNEISEAKQIEVIAEAKDGNSSESVFLNIVPKSASVSLTVDGQPVVNGAYTVYLNDTDTIVIGADVLPDDAKQDIKWTGMNAKFGTFDEDRNTHTLTISGMTATGTLTLNAQTMDKGAKKASLKLTIAKRADEIRILDSKGADLAPGLEVKGKGSYAFKDTVSTTKDKTITDKAVVWSFLEETPYASIDPKSGKLTVKSFATDSDKTPVSVTVCAAVASQPEICDTYVVTLVPDVTAGIEIMIGGAVVNDTTQTVSLTDRYIDVSANLINVQPETVTWAPTAVNGAAYYSGGQIIFNKAGTVTVTVSGKDSANKAVKASFKLTVVSYVEAIEVGVKGGAEPVVSAGKTLNLIATLTPAKPTNNKLVWSIDPADSAYATVSTAGVLKANAVSSVKSVHVTAAAADGSGASDTVEVTVYPASSSVTVSSSVGAKVDIGTPEVIALEAVVYPLSANQNVTWSSGNKSYPIDADGIVTVQPNAKAGAVTFTATTADGKKGTFKLEFTKFVTSLTLTDCEVSGGKTVTIPTVIGEKDATNQKLTWSMTDGDTSYATLSNGKLTAKKVTGTKHVTVKAETMDGSGLFDTCEVTLRPASVSVAISSNKGTKVDTATETTVSLRSVVSPLQAIQDVTWTSSNAGYKIDKESGVITIPENAKAATVTFTAATVDGKKGTIKIEFLKKISSLDIEDCEVVSGKSVKIPVTILDKDATNQKLTWTLVNDSDKSFATLSNGTLTAKKVTEVKTVKVKAEATDGSGLSDICDVTIYPASVSVAVSSDKGTKVDIATVKTVSLTAVVTPNDALQKVTWTSGNSSYKIDKDSGVITIPENAKPATVTFTAATSDGKKGTVKIEFLKFIKELTLEDCGVATSKAVKIPVTILDKDATNQKLTWTLVNESDKAVATLSNGTLTAKKVTEVTNVTVKAEATDGSGLSDTCVVTIYPAVTTAVRLYDMNGTDVTGKTVDFSDGMTFTVKNEPDGTMNSWSVKSANAAISAEIHEGTVTLKKADGKSINAGTKVAITVTANDGSGKNAKVTVTVK